jgi:hypothetical protein
MQKLKKIDSETNILTWFEIPIWIQKEQKSFMKLFWTSR